MKPARINKDAILVSFRLVGYRRAVEGFSSNLLEDLSNLRKSAWRRCGTPPCTDTRDGTGICVAPPAEAFDSVAGNEPRSLSAQAMLLDRRRELLARQELFQKGEQTFGQNRGKQNRRRQEHQ